MPTITFPSDTKDTIDAIRNAIGRNVTFYAQYRVPCSACSLDPITDTSINSFCLVCSGEGYVYTYSGTVLMAHITHAPAEILQWQTGGKLVDGDVRVQVEYTVANLATVKGAEYAMIDGMKFDVRNIILRGVQTINRILVDLLERIS